MTRREAVMREARPVQEPTTDDLHQMRVEEERERVPVPLAEPVEYYNPLNIQEQFRRPGTSYYTRFALGRWEATTDVDEETVRAALAGYGRDKADRWRGNDRFDADGIPKYWECKKCGFLCANDLAIDDHRETGR